MIASTRSSCTLSTNCKSADLVWAHMPHAGLSLFPVSISILSEVIASYDWSCAVKLLHQPDVKETTTNFCSSQGITWDFIHERAPQTMGGAVKSMKKYLWVMQDSTHHCIESDQSLAGCHSTEAEQVTLSFTKCHGGRHCCYERGRADSYALAYHSCHQDNCW